MHHDVGHVGQQSAASQARQKVRRCAGHMQPLGLAAAPVGKVRNHFYFGRNDAHVSYYTQRFAVYARLA
jgi:hypothetical protein